MIEVPVRNEAYVIVEWAGGIIPAHRQTQPFVIAGQGLKQAVQGCHLRAARGLLGWSMMQLAEASGLSLSTIRRLEGDAGGRGGSARQRTIAALMRSGVRFVVIDGGVGVAKA